MADMGTTDAGLLRFAGAWPAGPELTVFKHDARSRVVRVSSEDGDLVVKLFVYSPVRQRLGRLLRCHPAQREVQVQRRLLSAGLPVAPTVATGCRDGRLWLATRYVGQSLQRRLRDADPPAATTLIDAAAALTRRLIDAGWTFKDLKPSNILVAPDGQLQLIDTGSARPNVASGHIARMLDVMMRVLARDGVPQDLRDRYRRAVDGSSADSPPHLAG